MSVTPSGILSEPLTLLRTLIASTDAFQSWTSTASTAAAEARIYPHAFDDASVTRPFAAVAWEPGAIVGRGGYIRGTMTLQFESEISEQYQRGGDEETAYFDAALEHSNQVGAILEQAAVLAEADGMLHLDHEQMFRCLQPPARPPEAELLDGVTDYYWSKFAVEWGI